MRLDKYLKVSRLIKRRTIAAEFCKAGQVKINGQVAKAASELKVGDVLEIIAGEHVTRAKILIVPDKPVPIQACGTLYQVLT